MNMIETYRMDAMRNLKNVNSFSDSWTVWKQEILNFTDNMKDAQSIFKLGDKLAHIFQSTNSSGRAQASLSGGGAAWECLVCWYMNTIFTGSRAVVTRPTANLVPQAIRDATCIVYGNAQTNTESDLIVVSLPTSASYMVEHYKPDHLSNFVAENIGDVTVGVIQCKTNWNDNAQIPMLWDMVYRAEGFDGHSVRVGRNGYTPKNFKDFSYSFVTVPSQKDLSKFKSNSMSVKRVRNLSGGNYWGHETKSDVALSVSEIFNCNFGHAFDESIIKHIDNTIKNQNLSYFL